MEPVPGISLSTWAATIAPSPTLAVDAKAKQLQAAGENVCSFGAGEPDFDTPDFIKEACIDALRSGKTKYGPAAGLPELRSALAGFYRDRYKLDTAASQVVVSPGGKFSCYLAILVTCSPGDEVIIPAPYWVSYPEMVKLAGATSAIVPTDDASGFKITPDQLEGAITPRTRLFILNSPGNPTGTVYTRLEVEALLQVCLRHKITVLSDEIYERLLYDNVSHTCTAAIDREVAQSVITVSGFSKSFSMTGWRLGTLVAPLQVASAAADLQSQISSNPTTFAQYGALRALQEPELAQKAVDVMLLAFARRRELLHQGLLRIPGIECLKAQGAFYLFPNIKGTGLTSHEFAARLLEEEKVAVVPGHAFGSEGFIRLSYATSDSVILEGLERMERFCRKFA